MLKQNKAITLIALIITIIVLLVLAGVTINMVLGENGIINKSKTAVGKYENAQDYELAQLNTVIIEQKKEYTITFNLTGGEEGPTSIRKEAGKDINVSEIQRPKYTGHRFKGWVNSENLEDLITENYIMPEKDITLIAIWEEVATYTISYNANGGEGAPNTQIKTQEETLTLSTITPSKTGFLFAGWATGAGETLIKYKAGDEYKEDANKTLYAVWGKGVGNYTYTGGEQIFVAEKSGHYLLEVWGAGSSSVAGGHSKGVIKLNEGNTLFIYVGQQGNAYSGSTGGAATFNGGGKGGNGYGYSGAYSGGGATDIRTVQGDWNNEAGLESRIIVAGGAGGPSTHGTAGAGGGTSGGNATDYRGTTTITGATQTVGYSKGIGEPGYSKPYRANGGAEGNGGGGGGFYGGYTHNVDGEYSCAGGSGGSGYIGGVISYKDITAVTETSTHTGNGTATITFLDYNP